MRSWGYEVEFHYMTLCVEVEQIRITPKVFFQETPEHGADLRRYTLNLEKSVWIGPLCENEMEGIRALTAHLARAHPDKFKPLPQESFPTLYGCKLGIKEPHRRDGHIQSPTFFLSADSGGVRVKDGFVEIVIPEIISVPFPSFSSSEKDTLDIRELINECTKNEYENALGGGDGKTIPAEKWKNVPGRYLDCQRFGIRPLPFNIYDIDQAYAEWDIYFIPKKVLLGFRILKNNQSLQRFHSYLSLAKSQIPAAFVQLTGAVDITHFCKPNRHKISFDAMEDLYKFSNSLKGENELAFFHQARQLPHILCQQLMPMGMLYHPDVYCSSQYRIGVLGFIRFVVLIIAYGEDIPERLHAKNFFVLFPKSSVIKLIKLYFVNGNQHAYDQFVLHPHFIQLMASDLGIENMHEPMQRALARLMRYWYIMNFGTFEEAENYKDKLKALSVFDFMKAIFFSCLSDEAKKQRILINPEEEEKWTLLFIIIKCFDDERLGIDISPGRGSVKMEFRDIGREYACDALQYAPKIWHSLSQNIWHEPLPFDPDESVRVDAFGRSISQYQEIGQTHPFPAQPPLRPWV